MLRGSNVRFFQQLHKFCEATSCAGARDGSPELIGRLHPLGGHQLSLARGAASSPSPSGTSPRPAGSRLDTGRAAAAAASNASTSGSDETPLSFIARQQQALATMPPFPKMLGFAGAIPFLSLTPRFVETAGLPEWVDYFAQMQLVYGGSIVTFLGAVHWGLAMNSATLAAAGTKAAGALNERYVWSVVPSLAAVPALLMPPAQGSFSVAVLLAICYLSDASYFRAGYLPSWYMSLRGYLTLLAMLGMLSTTWYYFQKDLAKAQKLIEEEEARRLTRLETRAAAAGIGSAVEAPAVVTPAAQKAGRK